MPIRPLQADDPERLGPYRLTGRLGAGGMGVVYLGFDENDEAVAVKTLHSRADEESRVRMRREAEYLGSATSPHVARLVGCDVDAAPPWIALGYVAGPSLAEVAVPLPPAGLQALAAGLADALSALRAAGIVHRDVKPGNIILSFHGPVLVDLGISHTHAATALTQVGMTIGSPAWMSPEQFRGAPVTPATDVWGWGAVLAFAATGRPPFGEGDLAPLAYRIQSVEPDLEGVPPELLGPIAAALRKDPAQRPAPEALLSGAHATVRLATPSAAVSATGATVATPTAPTGRSGSRLGWWLLAACLVGALFVTAVVVGISGRDGGTAAGNGRERSGSTAAATTAASPSASTSPRTTPRTSTSSPRRTPSASASPARRHWAVPEMTAQLKQQLADLSERLAESGPGGGPPPSYVRCPEAVVRTGRHFPCYVGYRGYEEKKLNVLIVDAETRKLASIGYDMAQEGARIPPGASCYDISRARVGYYPAVVAYWFDQGRPARLDPDGNGRPCETHFAPESVSELWRGEYEFRGPLTPKRP